MRTDGRTRLLALPLGVVALLLTLLGSAQARALGATITIDDDGAGPTTVTVSPGDAIEFVNSGTERHRIRTTSGPTGFDTGDIDPGDSATVVVPFEGVYAWEDHRNDHDPRYQGTITVVPAGDPDPPDPGGPPAAPPSDVSVSILDRSFSPASVTIAAGGTVRWTNGSDRDHTVTADDASFDSGTLATSAGWASTFEVPGTYPYFCVIHPDMRGVVSVGTEDGAPPAPVPPPPPPPSTTAPPPPITTPPTSGDGPTTGTVNIVDFAFDPGSTSIRAGDTLVWQNFGGAPHTVTAEDGTFDSGLLSSGGSYRRTFDTPGSFTYFCTLHPEMRAVIAVGDADGPRPAPPPEPAPASPSPPPPPPPAPAPTGSDSRAAVTATVQMIDNAFRPSTLELRVGDRVVWANDGSVPHTAEALDGGFDTGFVAPGSQTSYRLSTAGTFGFFCSIHPEMTGTLIVAPAPAGAEPTPEEGGLALSATADGRLPTRAEGLTAAGGGAGDESAGEGGEEAPAPSVVAVIDNDFLPARLVVDAGTTVVWEWSGVSPHTVTARDGGFDSGILETGAVWSRPFDRPGRYAYYCTLHPDMTGVIEARFARGPDAPLRAATTNDGSAPLWPALVGGGVFLFGCAAFVTAALVFLRWSTAENPSISAPVAVRNRRP